MPFPSQPVLANFNVDLNPYTNALLSGISNLKSLSGVGRAITTGGFGANTAQQMVTEDGEVYITITTIPATTKRVILVARDDHAGNALLILVTNNGAGAADVALFTEISSSFALVSHAGQTWGTNDVVGMAMAGGTIDTYWNGTNILHDTGIGVRGAGYLGFSTDEETPQVDDFGGGPLVVSGAGTAAGRLYMMGQGM